MKNTTNVQEGTLPWIRVSRAFRGAGSFALLALALSATSAVPAGATPTNVPWPFAAPHAPAPLLGNPLDGPVIARPRVVPVLYTADPLVSDLKAFYAKLGKSTYIPAGLAEYGVGKVTVLPPVLRSDPPPAAIDDFAASSWLLSQIAAGALPAEDGSTVYALAFPASTQVTGGGVTGFSPFVLCGAINETATAADGTLVPFTISGLCEGSTNGSSDADSDVAAQASALTASFTDPETFLGPGGYTNLSWNGQAWSYFVSPFVSGLCAANPNEPANWTPPDLGYPVPRLWSNAAARAGHDPCIDPSAPRAVYFNAAPDVAGTAGPYGITKGIILPPGSAVSVPVRLFSDGPIGDWKLAASERSDLLPDPDGVLSFSFDKDSGTNGDVRTLTVRRATSSDGSASQALGFEITSTLGKTVHSWQVIVGLD